MTQIPSDIRMAILGADYWVSKSQLHATRKFRGVNLMDSNASLEVVTQDRASPHHLHFDQLAVFDLIRYGKEADEKRFLHTNR